MTERPPTLVRHRPRGLIRFLFRLPVYLYRGPIASLLAWRCVVVLTTIGRKTGLPRRTAVSAMRLDDRFIVFAGFAGIQADCGPLAPRQRAASTNSRSRSESVCPRMIRPMYAQLKKPMTKMSRRMRRVSPLTPSSVSN